MNWLFDNTKKLRETYVFWRQIVERRVRHEKNKHCDRICEISIDPQDTIGQYKRGK